MADVCEAFCLFRVFSGLITNFRVHSCPFVVANKLVVVLPACPFLILLYRPFQPRQEGDNVAFL